MQPNNQFSLLTKKRFLPFFITQFLGAFNDNIFKNALLIIIAYQAVHWTTVQPDVLTNVCAGLFILPFFLFSAMAGQLADKYEKSKLIRIVKIMEILIMLLATIGLVFHQLYFLIFVLFMLGVQSTYFGPVKYSFLPQNLSNKELVGGNGLVQMGTFIAILLGTIIGGILVSKQHHMVRAVSSTILIVSVLGYLSSRYIPMSKPNDPDLKINWEPFSQTFRTIKFATENRTVFLSILGNAWFWFFGAVVLTQIPVYVKFYLGGTEHVTTLLLTIFSVGIGLGSVLCEKLSGRRVELGLVPFGAIGMTVFGILLYLAHPGGHTGALVGIIDFLQDSASWAVLFSALIVGMFAGFYVVPLFAIIQQRSKPEHRSRIIAANNIIGALFMVGAALYAIVLIKIGLTIPQILLTTAIVNFFVAFYIFTLVPEFLMRFIIWLWMSVMYRIKSIDVERMIPEEGAAVLVCNHVSFIDALILSATVRRPIRFVMYHKIFNIPVLSFIFRTSKAIPIAPAKEDKALKEKAFEDIALALKGGDIVCLFPEGGITRDGQLQSFKPGIEQIIQTTPVPVIPVGIKGLWGSFFSRKYGKAMGSLPRRFRSKITVIFGKPVAPKDVSKERLYQAVSDLLE